MSFGGGLVSVRSRSGAHAAPLRSRGGDMARKIEMLEGLERMAAELGRLDAEELFATYVSLADLNHLHRLLMMVEEASGGLVDLVGGRIMELRSQGIAV